MEITTFIASRREALLISDYNTYRSQLSRQILSCRKRLGISTNRREKFSPRPITAENIGSNIEYAHLMLLTSERAWAHAMHIKTSNSEDASGRGLTGSTRSHIISRLAKAAKTANALVALLGGENRGVTKASEQDVLECRAYAASMVGAEEFEKQSGATGQRGSDGQASEKRWQVCLRSYSEARVVYAALLEKEKKEVFRDLLSATIDPTIRYAAYQAHLSRTIAISTVAKRYFPKEDTELVRMVEQIDPYALKDKPVPQTDAEKEAAPEEVPNSVTWRGRKANIVDASIGQALANVTVAEARLRSYLSANSAASNKDKAAAYDDILVASQDAADATKRATDELEKEKVDEGDARMQDLRITSLAVNYDLVSWRVGRNRILIGDDDGVAFEPQKPKKPKRLRKDGTEYPEHEEARGHKLGRLRERVVLFDAIIQSINSVKDLRGAMRDAKFVAELDAKARYFRALKLVNISYSHSLLDNQVNALALLKTAQDLVAQAPPPGSAATDDSAPLSLDLAPTAFDTLRQHISSILSRTHALVELHKFQENAATAAAKHMTSAAPLVQNLNAYPTPGTLVDLTNLVSYPPKIEPVPVKPLFLDVAWNYIDYPGKVTEAPQPPPLANGVEDEKPAAAQPEKKRGWFGFGR